jgi:hypothetical protein
LAHPVGLSLVAAHVIEGERQGSTKNFALLPNAHLFGTKEYSNILSNDIYSFCGMKILL